MPIKQQDFYAKLRQDIDESIKSYKDFQELNEKMKREYAERMKRLKSDMKFISSLIKSYNRQLKAQGQETVEFKDK